MAKMAENLNLAVQMAEKEQTRKNTSLRTNL